MKKLSELIEALNELGNIFPSIVENIKNSPFGKLDYDGN